MAENPFQNVRIKFKRSKTITKVVVLAAVILSMTALIVLGGAIAGTRAQTEALRSQAAGLEQENRRLEDYIEDLGTVQGIIQIAREKLGLVEPDTVIISPEE